MVKAVATEPQECPDSMIKVLDEAETNREKEPTPASIKDGIQAAWPICIGYIPLGLAFGILAQKAGFDLLDIGIMSTVVFAGSSQFIAVSMLSAGAAPLSIVLTTFAVNLRHVLMSSALAVYLHGVSRRFLSLFAYGVTDESFAVNIVRFREGGWHRRQALALNQVANFTWIASTVLGGYGGQFIAPGSFGIDYALSAMFLCLLVFQLQGRMHLLTAAIAGLLPTAVSILLPGNSFVIIASLLGATLGYALKRYALRKRWLNA